MAKIDKPARSKFSFRQDSLDHSPSKPETERMESPFSATSSTKKSGRPKNNGYKPMWMLERATLIVGAYSRARAAGEKHGAAIQQAVEFVRQTGSGMPISETEVRRTLASWQSSNGGRVLSVTEPDPANCTLTLPGGRVVKIVWTAAIGPRPMYPRTNAATSPRKRLKPNSQSVQGDNRRNKRSPRVLET